ncbi:hypothetical protein GCM10010346_41290 [Streptomyces chryseus]|uniref:Uncharacterized protein n=1 Tax=Streptomyces chryseus TaxID=68186 RepID=A0ABQ3DSL4_9ACTN|nr:hypothetical protein GCM10010346_41290 [Streptomyces chryseus]
MKHRWASTTSRARPVPPRPVQQRQDALVDAQDGKGPAGHRRGQQAGGEQRDDVRVAQGDPVGREGDAAQFAAPVGRARLGRGVALQVLVEFLAERLDQPVQQRVLARDVPVQGHRLDAQFGAQLAHAEAGQAVAVDHFKGRRQHAFPAQPSVAPPVAGASAAAVARLFRHVRLRGSSLAAPVRRALDSAGQP